MVKDPDQVLLETAMLDAGVVATLSTVMTVLHDEVPGESDFGALVALRALLGILRSGGIEPARLGGEALRAECTRIVTTHGPARLAALTANALIATRPDESRGTWNVVARALTIFAQTVTRLRSEGGP